MQPRLTIGIPTFNRPEMVARAIDSALGQTEVARIIVCDDGDSPRTERTCRNLQDENFIYLKSPAKTLWENWKYVAKYAIHDGAEFFLWLQDDDVIEEGLAFRVMSAFDRYSAANVYCSHLQISYGPPLACSFHESGGPKLSLDFLTDQPTEFDGKLLTPIGYFDVWAQSPAKAFRVGPAFELMLDALPDGCDKYTEALDLAVMGLSGTAIADPNMAGYWIMHGQNECDLTQDQLRKQAVVAFRFLDQLIEYVPDWRDRFFAWLDTPGLTTILQPLYNQTTQVQGISKVCDEIRSMLATALRVYHGMIA